MLVFDSLFFQDVLSLLTFILDIGRIFFDDDKPKHCLELLSFWFIRHKKNNLCVIFLFLINQKTVVNMSLFGLSTKKKQVTNNLQMKVRAKKNGFKSFVFFSLSLSKLINKFKEKKRVQ